MIKNFEIFDFLSGYTSTRLNQFGEFYKILQGSKTTLFFMYNSLYLRTTKSPPNNFLTIFNLQRKVFTLVNFKHQPERTINGMECNRII
jgi:hypothetical protein